MNEVEKLNKLLDTNKIISLREKSGCSLAMCKEAFEYCRQRDGVTPLGYLKAKTIAVNLNMNFDEKVKYYSRSEIE